MEQASFLQYVLFSWFIWGAFFSVTGVYLLGKALFDFGILKTLIALSLLYVGGWILVCGLGSDANRNTLVFNEAKLTASNKLNHFKVILGRGTIDMTALQAPANTRPQNVNIIFGWGTLMLDAGAPALVNVNSVLSPISMPGMNLPRKTGSVTYVSQAFQDDTTAYLPVQVRVWFGELKIFEIERKKEEKKPEKPPEKKKAA